VAPLRLTNRFHSYPSRYFHQILRVKVICPHEPSRVHGRRHRCSQRHERTTRADVDAIASLRRGVRSAGWRDAVPLVRVFDAGPPDPPRRSSPCRPYDKGLCAPSSRPHYKINSPSILLDLSVLESYLRVMRYRASRTAAGQRLRAAAYAFAGVDPPNDDSDKAGIAANRQLLRAALYYAETELTARAVHKAKALARVRGGAA